MKRLIIALCVCAAIVASGCGSSAPKAGDATTATSVQCPQDAKGAQSFDANTLIGQPLTEATATAAKYNCTVRTVEIDGQPQAATMDFRPDRINVSVRDGKVTDVQSVS